LGVASEVVASEVVASEAEVAVFSVAGVQGAAGKEYNLTFYLREVAA
jgi:hypothetical protein